MSASANPIKVTAKLKWVISNFTKEKFDEKGSQRHFSKNFQILIGDNLTEWYLRIKKHREEFLGIFVFNEKVSNDNFLVKIKVTLHDEIGELELKSDLIEVGYGWGWEDFLKLRKLFNQRSNYICQGNRLIINVEIKLQQITPEKHQVVPQSKFGWPYPNDERFSDFIIKCSDGINLPTHRIVLAYSSEVFMNMLIVKMEEKTSNQLHLEDVTSETMKVVLKFIYTGKIESTNLTEMIQVLNVAEKYQISALKSACCEQLIQSEKKENVIGIFIAADLYNLKNVEEKCLEIIVENYEELKTTEEWSQLTFPLLMKITDGLFQQSQVHITLENDLEDLDF